jgi:hypothetical protein
MSAPELILKHERALRSYLASCNYLPAAFPIFCAHEAAPIVQGTTDLLVINAGRPKSVSQEDAGNYMDTVELSLFTGEIIDEAKRLDAVALHDARGATLQWIFCSENFDALLAALNAPIEAGIGFSGWDVSEQGHAEDDRVGKDSQQLRSVLRYDFDLFRAA